MKMTRLHKFVLPSIRRQRGVTLLVGLLILLVMSLLAVTIVQVVTMQERMARNLRDQSIAFQAAEAALRSAEAVVNGTGTPYEPYDRTSFTAACTNGLCLPSASNPQQWNVVDWGATSTTSVGVTFTLPTGVQNPRYIIEKIFEEGDAFDSSKGCPIVRYRITARGFGQNGAVTNLQTLYRRKAAVSC